MKKELENKYFPKGWSHHALDGDREKLWLCYKNHHLFEKSSNKTVAEVCPIDGNVAFQPSKVGFEIGEINQEKQEIKK